MTTVSTSGHGFQPRPRHMALIAFALIVVFATIALPGMGYAGDTRTGNELVVEANERVTDDLYLAGGTVEFKGQADRDVSIVAGKATIEGSIAGSLNLGTAQSEVSGTIDGTLRILSGTVVVLSLIHI